MNVRAAAPAMLLLALSATAAAQARAGRMYVGSGLLIGSTRLVGMGGAFTGIAEGSAALTSNLATLAHRKPALDRDWNVDVALSYLDLPLGNPEARDLDNDGRADAAQLERELVTGVMLQLRGLGVGLSNRTSFQRYDELTLTLANSAVAAAIAIGDDELILAVGAYSTTGELEHAGARWSYAGAGPTVDALFRPRGQPFRLGVSVKPQVVAPLEGAPVVLAGRLPFAALASPLTFSIGGSARLGPGAERYNALSIAKRRELGEGVPATHSTGPPGDPPGRWLLSAQLDVFAPMDDAVPIHAIVEAPAAAPERVGARTHFAPRLGVEHETLPGRLRLRGGLYLEPSPFLGRPPRLHATAGFELFLFRHLEDWAVSFSADLAARYGDLGLSIGFWR